MDIKNGQFCGRGPARTLGRMINTSDRTVAKVLDFEDYRRRRAARIAALNPPRRQFLWGWSAGPQVRVHFPTGAPSGISTTRSRTL